MKEKIDAWNRSGEVKLSLCVSVEDFDSTYSYLTDVLKLNADDIDSYLDNPEEACIDVFLLPF